MTGFGNLLAPGAWPAFVYISMRLTGLMLVAPFWSMVGVPRTVRGAMVVVIAAALIPLAPAVSFPPRVLDLPLPLITELLIGLGIGLVAAVIQHALMLASEVVAMQSGLSFGQLLTADIETGGPAISQLYGYVGLATFVGIGGHLMLLEALGRSLATVPPGSLPTFAGGPDQVIAVTGELFRDAIQIAAPVMVALTISNLAMAILSRAVPQLNAMAMSFAVSIGVALVIFGTALPLLSRVVGRWYGAIPIAADAMVGAIAGTGR